MVDAELDWRERTDQQKNRREVVVLRARQILFESARSAPQAGSEPGAHDGSPNGESGIPAAAVSPAGAEDLPF